MKHVIRQFPNLAFTEEAWAASVGGRGLASEDRLGMFRALIALDRFGLDESFVSGLSETPDGGIELAFRGKSRKTWAFRAVADAGAPSKFVIVRFYEKPDGDA
ncbi:hypothetical protein [Paenibacillus flagellatus]|uniref:Uncharacterized protein n=1 Tax=Paenibacillus flagellatus TaxID=2211139 RepID=A0A2V5JW89_9BACL|nr:hypothetical protein [Paenibacillus flagellatus]PYI51055.1 hypothetical protein DLM86_27205 [Paenibacillus flagellatus]